MSRKAALVLCLMIGIILLIPSQAARANGDPVIRFSSVNRVGNPTPRKITDIQILKERLLIQPRGTYTFVEVEYTLHNHSNKNYKRIDYGFPIDYTGEAEGSDFTDDYISESLYEIGWKKEWIKDVHFSLDDKVLEWHPAHEVVTPKHKEYVVEYEDTVFIESASRLWHYTQFDIKKQDTVSLKVSYQVYQAQYVSLNILNTSPLSRHLTGGATFQYDFSPAQYWGDGTAHQLEVIVDCSVIKNSDIDWRQEYRFEGETFPYPFKLKGDKWICQMERFKFENAELRFGFSWGKRWNAPLSVLYSYEVDPSLYRIEASSAGDNHPMLHLNDKDIETTWTPQNNDTLKTIVITFHEPQVLSDLMLHNGNHNSVSDWMNTPRIIKLQMEIIWADGFREVKDLNLWGWNDDFRYYGDYEGYSYPCIIQLYDLVNKIFGRWIDDNYHPITENRISQIKLKILETYPTDSSENLCISEIVPLNGWKEMEELE